MKTKYVILSVLLLTIFKSNGQGFFGYATYKYKFSFLKDTLVGNLYFNSNGESEYITKNVKTLRKESNTVDIDSKIVQKVDTSVIYRNTQNKRSFYMKPVVLMKSFLVADTLKDLHWELLSATKKIGNFNCSSAKTKYSGRIYEVWYTTQIPVNTGPWKLHGLPGLIIEAYDEQKVAYFILDKIDNQTSHNIPISLEKLEKRAISKSDFNQEEIKYIEKLRGEANSKGVQMDIPKRTNFLELDEN